MSVVCFVLWPQRFVFERPVVEGALGVLFQLLSAIDLPYNRTPSLHISVLVILWVLSRTNTRLGAAYGVYVVRADRRVRLDDVSAPRHRHSRRRSRGMAMRVDVSGIRSDAVASKSPTFLICSRVVRLSGSHAQTSPNVR